MPDDKRKVNLGGKPRFARWVTDVPLSRHVGSGVKFLSHGSGIGDPEFIITALFGT